MAHCVKCGAPLPLDAQFCAKCGTPVVVPVVPVAPVAPVPPVSAVPPTAAPVARAAPRSTWWIVPLVIVGLVLVAWLLLAGLPFGGEKRVDATATTETIAEGTATIRPIETGTVVEVGADEEFATETAPPPPLATATQTVPPVTQTQPVIIEEPRVPQRVPSQPQPTPTRTPQPAPTRLPQPAPQPAPREDPPEPQGEIPESEASSILRRHLSGANPYEGVSARCLQIRGLGYRNVGYTFSVWDSCVEGGGSRMLGRWRVDAKTREVFRQRDDGRYLRP